MGSSIIPVETDWKSFYDSLNAKVRKEFQRRKKALSHLGPLKTVSSEITSESIKKIHSVEQTSWKHNWRKQHGITEDSTLNPILRASKTDEKTNPIYASEVWFLESAGQPIAYTLVLLYKETAFLVKTSYNSEFKKFGPGNLLTTEILHNLFQRKSVTKIDFVTNLLGDKIWKPACKNRIRITLNRNLLLSKLLCSIPRNFASVGRLMKKRFTPYT
jgi:CelD/BcsL family acetyltransferase involved in cellulose biosynthesis